MFGGRKVWFGNLVWLEGLILGKIKMLNSKIIEKRNTVEKIVN
jgi:hypothetical protein